MTIREQIAMSKQSFYELVSDFFQTIAKLFGFPTNPGMPILPDHIYSWNKITLKDELPMHQVIFPPGGIPQNYIEIILGITPKPTIIERIYYENIKDGYYTYYIPNFKNIFFLPNWLSEFIQIRCNFCVDISILEVSREVLFLILVCYYYLINARMFLGWLISINPYTFPLSYVISLVDWVDEVSTGILPSVGGTNYAMSILTLLVGMTADSLNHLVFTMPFLPSEGEPSRLMVDGKVVDVLIFRHLPYLWYKHPIPNSLRTFWYNERPDILQYMEKHYHQLGINFLPDPINITNNITMLNEHFLDKMS